MATVFPSPESMELVTIFSIFPSAPTMTVKIKKPIGRTLAEFKPLQVAEKILLNACRLGEVAKISINYPVSINSNNTVRATFLRFLSLGGDDKAPVHEQGVKLSGAWIEGKLDMASTYVSSDLSLINCHFNNTPVFRNAKITGSLNLNGCHLPSIAGDGLVCSGDLLLQNSLTSDGEISLLGAQIGGDFLCSNAKIDGKNGNALSIDRAVIKGGVFLNNGFTSDGEVRLLNAQIGSSLTCSGAKLNGKSGNALSADGAVIMGSVFLNDGFTSVGKIRLVGAQIGSNLSCGGAKFDGKDGDALSADSAVIKGSVFLNKGFTSVGKVRLLGAKIGSNLSCGGAKFDGKDGDALSADRAVIMGSVFLNDGFSSIGEVRLLSVQIGSSLSCNGANFDGKNGHALSADGAVIKGSVFLNDGFTSVGKVRLLGAQIAGNLSCDGAKFESNDGNVLSADGMIVEGAFFFRKLAIPIKGISLASCHVGRLIDDSQSWGENLLLNGFIYDSLSGDAPTDAETRIVWLNKQSKENAGLKGNGKSFRPQPWRQLAKALREMGHAEDARQIAIAFEHRLRTANLIGLAPKHKKKLLKLLSWVSCHLSRMGHWLFWLFTGYGYRPLRLLGWMTGVWLACAAIYWYAALAGVFSPSNPLVFQNPKYSICSPSSIEAATTCSSTQGAGNWYLCEILPEEYAGFSPLAYSLDVILPLVDLQQETSWSPLIPTPKDNWYKELFMFDAPKHWIRLVLWFEIIFGWVSSLLLVAVVSGLTKRREE